MAEWRKICCAVDFSESSGLAVNEAADLAKRFQAELTVLHVYEAPAAAAAALEVPLLEHVQRAAGEAERKLAECRSSVEQKVSRAVRSAMPRRSSPSSLPTGTKSKVTDLREMGCGQNSQ